MEMDSGALRRGQRGAMEVIVGRFRRRENNTAIVLPTRYGKSDLARVTSLRLWNDGEMSCALALSPNEILREQLADSNRWNEALLRYRIKPKSDPCIAVLPRVKVRPNSNGEMFLSATIQLVQANLDIFAQWVEYESRRTGLPPLVWCDEAHAQSDTNAWGSVPQTLAEAGAHVVLMTATPERSDGQRIPGFEFETIEVEDVQVVSHRAGSRPELVRVDLFEGVKTTVRLRAHYEVTFGEAFAENALCKISRTPFDVDLRTVRDDFEEHVSLSELSPTRARSELGSVVRHPLVITEGVARVIAELRRYQRLVPEAGVFVYCGNDTEKDDPAVNKHAQRILADFRRQAPDLDGRIVTSATGTAKEDMQRFASGRGDVAIVKQMASVGLDIGRLVIGLDLSPTRTYAALVQRMMRPATPYGPLLVCTWITPDDVVSKAVFERVVSDQGGEAETSDLTLVRSYEKERTEPPIEARTLFVDGTDVADFSDSHGSQAEGALWRRTSNFISHLPLAIQGVASAAEIALALAAADRDDAEGSPPTVRNTTVDADALRAEINQLAADYTKAWIRHHDIHYDSEIYRKRITDAFTEAKARAGWQRKANGRFHELNEIGDLMLLERVRNIMEGMLDRIESGGDGA